MEAKLFNWKDLSEFVVGIMKKLDVSEKDARSVAENLVVANLRGIDSHGVARLKRYVDGIKTGYIIPKAQPKILKESSTMANIDGQNGLGQVAGTFGMGLTLDKCKKEGLSLVTVCNSNHYGIAGYYAMQALKYDFIGVSLTNSAPLVVPTFSRNALIGTNPIAVAVPTKKNRPWVCDMATSVVPRGKLEVYNRLSKKLPTGWATDEFGHGTDDPARVLKNLLSQLGGGIFPLGGEGELQSGHKGYGLSAMVDVFTALLSGSNYGPHVVSKKEGKVVPPRVGHMFMAIDPEYFIGTENLKKSMDDYIDMFKSSEKAEGESRVYVHGEKEYEMSDKREKEGILLDAKTVESLTGLSQDYQIPLKMMN
jgi:L-2-hydroxycarboxylate dehydrogenase (NAD+)